MSDNVFVNRDKTRVVPAGSVEAKWQITRKEAYALGLLESEEKPTQRRRVERKAEPQKRRPSTKGLNRGLNEDS